MAAKTRLGAEGYGVQRIVSFAGKTQPAPAGPHPVGILTRLSLDGYGAKRAGTFGGKTSTVVAAGDNLHSLPFFVTVGPLMTR